jgi:PAS domain S-box-containing protein
VKRGAAELLHELRLQQEELASKTRELAAARAELERAVAHYEDVYENAPIAYVVLDPYGSVVDLNLTATRLFGIDRERLVQRPFSRLLVDRDRPAFLEHMRRCRHDGFAKTQIPLLIGGEPVSVQLDSRQTASNGAPAPQYRTAVVDLRDRERAEAARRRGAASADDAGSQ